jgi:hypothetical protein
MLSNFSPQYSPLISQFPGLQGAGWPQMSPALFGQSGAYGSGIAPFSSGVAPFGYELGQPGTGVQTNPFINPYLQHNLFPNSFGAYAGAHNPAQQIVLVLAQLAQQISVQSALIQQVSVALQQLAHQLAMQGLQAHQVAGLGAGQPFGLGGPFATHGYGSYGGQGGYGGFAPQVQPQAWGANRAQTIQ